MCEGRSMKIMEGGDCIRRGLSHVLNSLYNLVKRCFVSAKTIASANRSPNISNANILEYI